jgi:hypothetical protein
MSRLDGPSLTPAWQVRSASYLLLIHSKVKIVECVSLMAETCSDEQEESKGQFWVNEKKKHEW